MTLNLTISVIFIDYFSKKQYETQNVLNNLIIIAINTIYRDKTSIFDY